MVLIILAVMGSAAVLAVAVYISKDKHPVLKAFSGAVCGIGALCAVNILSAYTCVSIALNYITVPVSVVLSVPGVILLLLLRLVFTD